MAQKIGARSDKDGGQEEIACSDERLNVSSRADTRGYYASRDNRKAFSLSWNDASTAATDYVAYIKNNSSTDIMVVTHASLNSEKNTSWQMFEVTGTATGGAAATLVCENRANPRVADATARSADSSTVASLTNVVMLDQANSVANGHEEFRSGDTVRIGQGQAIAIRAPVVASGPGISFGKVFVYFEEADQ